ncbi:hypothetical protein NGB36_01470 [Streptomyces sp. RB6PN25]|uniref:Uncharacterized protein n=1 Tax=Streptomyces humicola TaxID=2953240 RepID=A0ABT1PNQ1_9ACTN|nr:hypothetical protein [Streptomyces humicola]MCQ4079308.1 hypothetical protein [Streptomyces humicola]
MGIRFTPRGDDREETAAAVAWLCERDGVMQTLRPVQASERRIARVVVGRPTANDNSGRA